MRRAQQNKGKDMGLSFGDTQGEEEESMVDDTFINRRPIARRATRLDQVIQANINASKRHKLDTVLQRGSRGFAFTDPPTRPTLKSLLSEYGIYRMPESDDDAELDLASSDDDDGRLERGSDSEDDDDSSEGEANVRVMDQQEKEEDWTLIDEYKRRNNPHSNVILHFEEDPWETRERKEKQESFERAIRRTRIHQQNMRRAAQAAKEQYQAELREKERKEVEDLSHFMRSLELERKSKEESLNKDYEMRNKQLWDEIDAAIFKHEKRVADEQAAHARRLAEIKAAEEKARVAREAEQAKIKAEQAKLKAEQAEKERKDRELLEKIEKEKAEKEKVEREKLELERKQKAAVEAAESANQETRKQFLEWRKKMREIKSGVLQEVKGNAAKLKACQQAKREMRPKIGQLTNGAQQVAQIISSLNEMLEASKRFDFSAYIFCLNTLSKLLINQVNMEAKTDAIVAYPLAKVVMGLILLGHKDLGEVLMARLVKKCFWLCGYFPKKSAKMEDREYQKITGQIEGETSPEYQLRMASYVTFYAAICQTLPTHIPIPNLPPTSVTNVPLHFRPQAAWKFLVVSIDKPMSLQAPMTLLLHAMIETAGTTLIEIYNRQFKKFLKLLRVEGIEGKKAEFPSDSQGLQKLHFLLNDIKSAGTVPPLKGRFVE